MYANILTRRKTKKSLNVGSLILPRWIKSRAKGTEKAFANTGINTTNIGAMTPYVEFVMGP